MSTTLKPTIALYGGSFDPPHIAHLEVIYQTLACFELDLLFVLVAHQNPFKNPPAFTPKQRLLWMQELLRGVDKVQVSDYEIQQERPVPSIQSVRHFHKTYAPQKLYFVMGTDNVASLKDWEGYDELIQLAHFILVQRQGYPIDTPPSFAHSFLPLDKIKCPISSTQIKAVLEKHQIPPHLPPLVQEGVVTTFKENHENC
ncbi:nicotinate (nicotinamide) nucleotide adenylyltransferase [Helicobacter ailurogastricus]|uniref:Probable nicotinate-nucleotide adenylyltransferase n=1 Tax=Helicobacter ailurogastricus TaxID=1578720 RepID=A0A0K2Y4S1_9HELI|nr:nicotinate (nicotinamide) nucleotide adenylyltransferase [Helicobacter ailurogastricus]BDQ28307.1 putative nicotinate-nucleotide adenylyltransferase [Helicobacter ailurogastricus]CRF52839.1 Nicotinate-nucleotide adenylyltransferase [Helicobacter ailurogastricus]